MARKKYGANKVKCDKYRSMNTRVENKKRKLKRHLKTHKTDTLAKKALEAL